MLYNATKFNNHDESIFARMTRLANEQNALNLAQGFPDFNGPLELVERIHAHLDSCPNQYTRSAGHQALTIALHHHYKSILPRSYDPMDEITVVNGATEGLLCAIIGLLEPTKKILVFEPFYESYASCANIAGASLRGVSLIAPCNQEDFDQGAWHIDWNQFDSAIDSDIGMIMLNHPHNPTGKVFSKEEMERIFSAAKKIDIPVVIDAVYENLVYEPFYNSFEPFLGKYSDRIIYISSISKSFSYTGFKVGWVLAPKPFMKGIRAVHEAAVFCLPPHLQLAVADLLLNKDFMASYFKNFRTSFLKKGMMMRSILTNFGFSVPHVQGSYFLLAQKNKAPLSSYSDHDLTYELLDRFKIAAIPVSGFFTKEKILKDWIRFAFCKDDNTIMHLKNLLFPVKVSP